jgi:hypothetical protein
MVGIIMRDLQRCSRGEKPYPNLPPASKVGGERHRFAIGRKRWKFLHTHEVGQSCHSNRQAILRAHCNSSRDKSCCYCQHNRNCDH